MSSLGNPASGLLTTDAFLLRGGELGALTRARDWSATAVGPIHTWPQSLRTALSIVLNSRYPMFLFWGPDAVCFYNDGYRPSLGAHKHPSALGQSGSECWSDIWHIIGPQIDAVMTLGDVTWFEDQLVPFDRSGYFEEIYFTYSYSPVRDESGGVGGTLVVCSETTDSVIGDRRLQTLGDLANGRHATHGTAEAIETVCGLLAQNGRDVPFVSLYEVDQKRASHRVVFSTGLAPGAATWPLQRVAETGNSELVVGLDVRATTFAANAWPEPAREAFVQPISLGARSLTDYILVTGVSPRKAFDPPYRTFYELVASQVSSAIGDARFHEAERNRVSALAELDRAKTEFFGNISHELRTPLTLLVGPLEDLLASGELQPQHREPIEMAHRNSLRLLQLVNALLDFSRIEAGRIDASYQPVDLAQLTANLAGVFRAAIERAGLQFQVECRPLADQVYVDRQMWEKIVFNLLSNAFKFTLNGAIRVELREVPGWAEMTISDTGTGIPEHELSRIFERFHRVAGSIGRSHEGTGIGLALVDELVRLHGGTIAVSSAPGAGTTFTVRIPFGSAHLAAEHLSLPVAGTAYAAESSTYLQRSKDFHPSSTFVNSVNGANLDRVLYADDNADMRSYVAGLLAPQFDVVVVADGAAALESALENPPDIVLTDLMMPVMDGMTLLENLRRHPQTRDIPVVLLSARSGAEASVEGLQAGADDYLAKPFNARELTARLKAHLSLRRERKRTRDMLIQTFEQAPVAIAVHRGPELIYEVANPLYQEILRGGAIIGRPLLDVIPEFDPDVLAAFRKVLVTGVPYQSGERPILLDRDGDGRPEEYWFNFACHPQSDLDGSIAGVIAVAVEVTEEVQARKELERANRELEEFAYVASHDLQEPLRTVNIYTQLLIKQTRLDQDDQAQQFATSIRDGVHRMDVLIKDLLSYSQIVSSEREIGTFADLNQSFEEALKTLEGGLQEGGAVVTSDELPVVIGDERQLTQVFANLLSNSLKYRNKSVAPVVHVSAQRRESDWVIRVTDNGIGFEPQYAERIFGLFKRLHKGSYPGTGLGLAICKRIVERSGGTMWAVSEGEGKGATIFFTACAENLP